MKRVNTALIKLYCEIDQNILEKQQKHKCAKFVVETLAFDLKKEFTGIYGFSVQNLWNMRRFYVAYQQNQKLQVLTGEIGWTNNIVILEKCKDELVRKFYTKMAFKYGWLGGMP